MPAERDREPERERQETGRQPTWKDVYQFMRCPKQLCDSAPHCLTDKDGTHYPMNGKHMRTYVEHASEHGIPKTQDDIPHDLRLKVIAEARERMGKQASKSGLAMTPIHITNVLPSHSLQPRGEPDATVSDRSTGVPARQPLEFRDLRDVA
ncbi:hypothetical protein EDD37DRAFT_606305 [Exophiala viscosa]|uniref:uncharacterized protein n=1 Tax=Exophiala viscosa TaxID=2486360 RepID=UPI00219076ED|nr:hypothetical protein EDD37DRAFT_606305 [Exophiala viscosa]